MVAPWICGQAAATERARIETAACTSERNQARGRLSTNSTAQTTTTTIRFVSFRFVSFRFVSFRAALQEREPTTKPLVVVCTVELWAAVCRLGVVHRVSGPARANTALSKIAVHNSTVPPPAPTRPACAVELWAGSRRRTAPSRKPPPANPHRCPAPARPQIHSGTQARAPLIPAPARSGYAELCPLSVDTSAGQ